MVSMINSLQIILHLPILGVQEPSNVLDTFSSIIPIVGFDVIESFDLPYLKNFLHVYDTELDDISICDQVVSLGYESHNPILNMGFMSILIFLYILKLCIFFLLILPINKLSGGGLKKLKKELKNQLFFEEILVIFIEGYFEILLSGLLIEKVPVKN